jgi:trk system potassium uptake protein TrkA
MRVVIIGGGEIGFGVGRKLAPRHEVVVVDHQPSIGERFATLDVQFIAGNGTNPDVLAQAGAAQADFVIAATGVDEVNVLASLIANRLGSPKTICLASREDLFQPLGRDLLREHVGIDRVVWPEAQLAEDIERIVTVPGAIDVEAFADGRVALLEYPVRAGSRLLAGRLSDLHLPRGVLVVAIRRHDRLVIPSGATRLEAGDKIFIMGLARATAEVQDLFDDERRGGGRLRVTVVGGGDVGLRLAQALEERPQVDVTIIERDPARGAAIAAILRRALVLNGDGTDLELLETEDIGRSDVLISVIDNDERNLFASVLARQLGVRRVITRVSRQANLRLFERVGIDVALSARGAAIAAIVHHVEGGPWNLLAVLEEGQGEVIELQVPPGYPPAALQSIEALRGAVVGAVIRGGDVVVPGGADTIHGGDRLLIVTTGRAAEALRAHFTAAQG